MKKILFLSETHSVLPSVGGTQSEVMDFLDHADDAFS